MNVKCLAQKNSTTIRPAPVTRHHHFQSSSPSLTPYFVGACVCMSLLTIGYIVKISNSQIFSCVCSGVGHRLGTGENHLS